MKLGGKYRIDEITRASFEKLARELRLEPDAVIARARAMSAALPDEAARARRAMRSLRHPILDRLVDLLATRAPVSRAARLAESWLALVVGGLPAPTVAEQLARG